MLEPRAKMRINLAVKDYIKMFPEDYKDFLVAIQIQRDQLDNEMAEIKETHAVKRVLSTCPEKLIQMIQKKLTIPEMQEFKDVPNQRWFVTEHPQFRVTKNV